MSCKVCETIERDGWNSTGAFHCGDSPRAGIVGCHARWRSPNRIHTVCCHRTFASDGVERKYHHTREGKCRDEDELRAAGAVWRHDEYWGGPDLSEEAAARFVRGANPAIRSGDPGDLGPRP